MTAQKFLFFVPYGTWEVHNQVEAIVARALTQRGAQAVVLRCDGLYQDRCYLLSKSTNPQADCAHCVKTGNDFFASQGIATIQLSQFISQEDKDQAHSWANSLPGEQLSLAEYEGLEIGRWAAPTVCSRHLTNADGLKDPDIQITLRRFLAYSLLTYIAAQRAIEAINPDGASCFNGAGFCLSPFVSAVRKKGIRFFTHDRGYGEGSFMLGENESVVLVAARKQVLSQWISTPLTARELDETKQSFSNWENGKKRDFGLFYNFSTSASQIRRLLNIPLNAKIFSVFPTSEHETLYSKDWRILERQMEMMSELIEVFRERKDDYLVIRHHPNVCHADHLTPHYDYIYRAYKLAFNAPDNVRIIMPYEKITSYALLWNSAASIAFISTIGVEAAARAVPCASYPISIYSDGMTEIIKDMTREELSGIVDRLLVASDNPDLEVMKRAYRSTNILVHQCSTSFNSFGIKNLYEKDIKVSSNEQLAPGNDPTLDRVCNFLMGKGSLYLTPPSEINSDDLSYEDQFIRKEAEALKVQKQQVKIESEQVIKNYSPAEISVIIRGNNALHEWIGKQRYPNIKVKYCPLQQNYLQQLRELLVVLEEVKSPYVLFTPADYQYDESVLTHSVDILDSDSKLMGITWGAWRVDCEGKVIGEVLHAKGGRMQSQEIINLLGRSNDPLSLLGLCVLRTDLLRKIIPLLGSFDTEAQCTDELAQFIQSESFAKPGTSMVLVPVEPKKENVSSSDQAIKSPQLEAIIGLLG